MATKNEKILSGVVSTGVVAAVAGVATLMGGTHAPSVNADPIPTASVSKTSSTTQHTSTPTKSSNTPEIKQIKHTVSQVSIDSKMAKLNSDTVSVAASTQGNVITTSDAGFTDSISQLLPTATNVSNNVTKTANPSASNKNAPIHKLNVAKAVTSPSASMSASSASHSAESISNLVTHTPNKVVNPSYTTSTNLDLNTGNITANVPAATNGTMSNQEVQLRSEILSLASGENGMPYIWGASNPSYGFDCSGLTSWVYSKVGVYIPRTADEQYHALQGVTEDNAKPGDLVFFHDSTGYVYHVGIVVDAKNHMYWEANHPGGSVGYRSYSWAGDSVTYGSVFNDPEAKSNVNSISIPNAKASEVTNKNNVAAEPVNYNPSDSLKNKKPVSGKTSYVSNVPTGVKVNTKGVKNTSTPSSTSTSSTSKTSAPSSNTSTNSTSTSTSVTTSPSSTSSSPTTSTSTNSSTPSSTSTSKTSTPVIVNNSSTNTSTNTTTIGSTGIPTSISSTDTTSTTNTSSTDSSNNSANNQSQDNANSSATSTASPTAVSTSDAK